MRGVVLGCLVLLLACGHEEAPPPAPPVASAPPPVASAAPSASASLEPVASAAPEPTASAAPAPPAFTKTLKELVGQAKIIKLTWREKLDSNEAKVVTIRAPQTIRAIVDALGADQVPAGGTPSYMWTFSFRFEDAKENPLATVSLYSSDSLAESAKKYGRIDVAADGTFAGIAVSKYEELQKKLKGLGVTLP